MSKYHKYTRLEKDSIRLIELLPPETRDTRRINISFVTTRLSNALEYDALSYTWGSSVQELEEEKQIFSVVPRCYPIYCEGKIVLASQNLRDILLRLHLFKSLEDYGEDYRAFAIKSFGRTTSKFIWIDAICINQEDPDERGTQVALMGTIYRAAACVIGFIGEADLQYKNGMQVLDTLTLNYNVKVLQKLRGQIQHLKLVDPELYKICGLPFISTNDWLDVKSVLTRTWFERGWVNS